MNQLVYNHESSVESHLKNWVIDAIKECQDHTAIKQWMSIKEACEYIGVSYNTFSKYREMGLKVCEIDGIKRVSRVEIDNFLNSFSY